jgi:predicted nucleic acid-binding protein
VIFVDSSAWIGFFNDADERVADRVDEALQQDEPLCIADLVLTEVLQGFRRDRDFELAKRTLAGIYRLPLSYATHVNAARLHRKLRGRGVTPKTVDCIIAQACLDTGASLLTVDRDFAAIARHSRLRLLAV